jgi:hypothetical protein
MLPPGKRRSIEPAALGPSKDQRQTKANDRARHDCLVPKLGWVSFRADVDEIRDREFIAPAMNDFKISALARRKRTMCRAPAELRRTDARSDLRLNVQSPQQKGRGIRILPVVRTLLSLHTAATKTRNATDDQQDALQVSREMQEPIRKLGASQQPSASCAWDRPKVLAGE